MAEESAVEDTESTEILEYRDPGNTKIFLDLFF
jgi:hypothetical protein